MKQSERIEIFLNWLYDNNYGCYIEWFKNAFNVKKDTYTSLIEELKTTHVYYFIDIVKDGVLPQNQFEYELMFMSWSDFCDDNMEINNDNLYFENGEYIKYSVKRYGIKTDYIAIIEICEDGFISEYCSAVINSDDDELKGQTSYYDKFEIEEQKFYGFRLARENEIKWLNKHLKEYDNIIFDKDKKELIDLA